MPAPEVNGYVILQESIVYLWLLVKVNFTVNLLLMVAPKLFCASTYPLTVQVLFEQVVTNSECLQKSAVDGDLRYF